MTEEWRQVPGYPYYDVSSEGRVRSRFFRKVRILTPGWGGGGYGRVYLFRPGGRPKGSGDTPGNRTVQSLVMAAFVGDYPEADMHIRHLDGNPRNNALTNLAYGTQSENVLDAIAHGTHSQASKPQCPKGHPYDEANTYEAPSRPGWRYCRTCDAARKVPIECGCGAFVAPKGMAKHRRTTKHQVLAVAA